VKSIVLFSLHLCFFLRIPNSFFLWFLALPHFYSLSFLWATSVYYCLYCFCCLFSSPVYDGIFPRKKCLFRYLNIIRLQSNILCVSFWNNLGSTMTNIKVGRQNCRTRWERHMSEIKQTRFVFKVLVSLGKFCDRLCTFSASRRNNFMYLTAGHSLLMSRREVDLNWFLHELRL